MLIYVLLCCFCCSGSELKMANSMEHVIAGSDYLTLHAPVIKGVTEGMINREVFEQMRPR